MKFRYLAICALVLAVVIFSSFSFAFLSTEVATANHPNCSKLPKISAQLANDTVLDDGTRTDSRTSDPTIEGKVSKSGTVTKLLASFKETGIENFVDVTSTLKRNGDFELDFATLEQVNGGALKEGENTVYLTSIDKQGNSTCDVEVPFTLNRVLIAFVNMLERKLGLINTETDQLVFVSLDPLGIPAGRLQHVMVTPDESTIYVTTDASVVRPSDAATVTAIKVNSINWYAGTADLKVVAVTTLAPAGSPAKFPSVSQVDAKQPIASWTQPSNTQVHGPTFLPKTHYGYFTDWTGNEIWAFNWKTNKFIESTEGLNFGEKSQQSHGMNFNAAGTYAVDVGYYYDQNKVDVFTANPSTGLLNYESSIELTSPAGDGAFSHYAFWLDNRYALLGTMQLGRTSLTPPGKTILGPSVWLLDVPNKQARLLIGPTNNEDGAGIFRSASDVGVVGNKLYVAEEDSLDDKFGEAGYISVFDISNINQPYFLKRFKPGIELPKGFALGHVLTVAPDKRYVYVSDYVSNHLIKIDSLTDTVVKIYSSKDGLDMPHGEFAAGLYR